MAFPGAQTLRSAFRHAPPTASSAGGAILGVSGGAAAPAARTADCSEQLGGLRGSAPGIWGGLAGKRSELLRTDPSSPNS
eukprot:15442491-Alexandrium_andersonii.AAC.1